jgi:hypothetical protein
MQTSVGLAERISMHAFSTICKNKKENMDIIDVYRVNFKKVPR